LWRVSTDECAAQYKRAPIIPFEERIAIVRAIRFVDEAVAQVSLDKLEAWMRYRFHVFIVGDDASQRAAVAPHLDRLAAAGLRVVFDEYYPGVSTSEIIARFIERDRH